MLYDKDTIQSHSLLLLLMLIITIMVVRKIYI
jgi:hypothetical protein